MSGAAERNVTVPTDPDTLLGRAQDGDRVALARLLSYIDRGGVSATAVARLAYRGEVPYTVGLTGAPGAGKSTLTDGLITAVRGGWPEPLGHEVPQVAVLAVDPTSPFSGGAILGDRVRMGQHTLDPTVFIRSMATRGHLGGLSLAVPDAVRLLGAAGLGVVIIETVGVGQMEVDVASAADTTAVVVTPGWGDSMQANKAGLLEVADVFVINKADRPGVARGPPRSRADARPLAPGRLAARDRRDHGHERGGYRCAVAGRGPAPVPPRGQRRAGDPEGGTTGPGAAPGVAGPGRGPHRRGGGERGVRHRRQSTGSGGERPLRGGGPPAGGVRLAVGGGVRCGHG